VMLEWATGKEILRCPVEREGEWQMRKILTGAVLAIPMLAFAADCPRFCDEAFVVTDPGESTFDATVWMRQSHTVCVCGSREARLRVQSVKIMNGEKAWCDIVVNGKAVKPGKSTTIVNTDPAATFISFRISQGNCRLPSPSANYSILTNAVQYR